MTSTFPNGLPLLPPIDFTSPLFTQTLPNLTCVVEPSPLFDFSNPLFKQTTLFPTLHWSPQTNRSVPNYLQKHPNLINAVTSLLPMAKIMMYEKEPTNFELEARFGRMVDNRFVPGVSQEFMDNAMTIIQTFKFWSNVSEWNETHDFYFDLNMGGQETVRSTVSFVDKTKTMETTHMIKTSKAKKDLLFWTGDDNDTGKCYDIRVSLSKEEIISPDILPPMAKPKYIRIKQRKSFLYTSQGKTKPTWSFDFTMSWSGRTKEEAEQNQRTKPAVMEIECECLDSSAYLHDAVNGDYSLMTSLLFKMLDFLPKSFQLNPIE